MKFINKRVLTGSFGLLAAAILTPTAAFAASSFSDHLWQFTTGSTNLVDFNRGYSRIYDDADLSLATDSKIFLRAPEAVVVSNDLNVNHDVHVENALTANGDVTGTHVILSKDRATSATGSFQNVEADLTLAGAAAGTFNAGVMGHIHGSALSASASYHAGVIGGYSVTGSDASTLPRAGVVGAIGIDGPSTVGDGAFVAVLEGDGGVTTANAAYGVTYLNSTAGSKFSYGLDLSHAAIGSYAAVTYGTADIRLAAGTTISSGTANPGTCVKGSIFLNTTSGLLNVCQATNTWTAK